MKILILSWRDIRHPKNGGSEVWLHSVAEGLADIGHTVTIFAAAAENLPTTEMINGVKVFRSGNSFSVYSSAKCFYRDREHEFDVILEIVNTRPFFSGVWSNTPSVVMIHQVAKEVWRYEAPFPISLVGRYIFEPIWLRRLSREMILTLSPSSQDSLKEYGINDADVVLPGSDCSEVTIFEKETTPTLVFLGRMVKSKRPKDVLDAFRILKDNHPDANLWMIGDGVILKKLRKSNVGGVTFFGHVSFEERQRLLSRAHLLVATSVREGWGLNVSEAACVGTPTIGYDSPGLVDSIPMSGGRTVKQSPDELASVLADFFNGKFELHPQIGTQSWPHVVKQIETALIKKLGKSDS